MKGTLTAACASLALACAQLAPAAALAQTCGALPADYGFFGGSRISLKKDTTINGIELADGATTGNAVVSPDGSRDSGVTLALPALDPAAFPANDATAQADGGDSPFAAGSSVFYDQVRLANDSTAAFSGGGPFHISTLDAGNDVTLRLGAGTYYVDRFQAGKDFNLELTGGPVVIHIGSTLQVAKDSTLNDASAVDELRVFLHSGATFRANQNLSFTGLIYGPDADRVQIAKDATLRGYVAIGGDIALQKDTAITYTPADQAAVGAVSTCDTGGTGLHHLRLVHDGAALTCLPETVTVQACADADCADPFTGAVQVTLSPGGWLGGDTVTVTGGAGDFQLRHTTPETVTLGVTASSPLPDNPTVCVGAGVTGQCGLAFAEAGFAVDLPAGVACEGATATLRAVKTADDGEGCAPALTGTRTVNLWTTHVAPATGGSSLVVDGTPTGTAYPGLAATLDFDANAEATVTVRYDDAGQVQLNARYQGSGDEAGLVLTGSDSAVRRPFALALYSDQAGAECPSADASCSPFVAAGTPFRLRARAVCGPDDGDLTNNPVTPNFQLAGIVLSHQLVAPAGGDPGGIGVTGFAMDAADGGEHLITDQSVSEVGVFTFSTPELAYLGSTVPAAVSAPVGRFFPADFQPHNLQAGTLANGCPGFTYSGQEAGGQGAITYLTAPTLDLTARNAAGTATANYTGDFAALTPAGISVTPPAADADQDGADGTPYAVAATLQPGTLTDLGQLAPGDPDYAPGSHRYRVSASDHFRYLRDADALVAPFTGRLLLAVTAIVDGDGVAAVGLPVDLEATGADIRFARVALEHAHGSELEDLALPLTVEQFDGSRFVPNPDEDGLCTTPAAGDLALAKQPAGQPDPTVSPVSDGRGAVLFPCASLGCEPGYVDVTVGLAGYPWLRYDWDNADGLGDGPFDDDPAARATFGIHRGSPAVIYRREP